MHRGRVLLGATGIALTSIAAMLVAFRALLPDEIPSLPSRQAAADETLVRRGEYLSRVGDCIACHSAKDGEPYAGGLAFSLPIGTIYSTNITSDQVHGIGDYSLEAFDRAIRGGIARDGHPLYPAMPFPSFAKVSRADVEALYAYFMHGVAPSSVSNRPAEIAWPLSIRWPLNVWRLLFAPAPTFTGQATDHGSSNVDRGAYLVQGLGHCGACHTPRGIGLQEKALSDVDEPTYLSGGVVDDWLAKSLRGDRKSGLGSWSELDIDAFLRDGRTTRTAAFGGMVDVVSHSTQYLSAEDRHAISAYLKSLPATAASETMRPYDDQVSMSLRMGDDRKRGAATYIDNCAPCHRTDGRGYAGVFPALAGNSAILTSTAESVIHIVLSGGEVPSTAAAPSRFAMPAFAWRLDDQQAAEVVTFIRSSWGNDAPAVDARTVGKMRTRNRLSLAEQPRP